MIFTARTQLIFTALLSFCLPVFAEPPPPSWINDLHLNLILNQGTSETLNLKTGVSSRYNSDRNSVNSSVEYSFGEATLENADGVRTDTTTTDRVEAETQANHLMSERTYALLGLTALKDRIDDIQYRSILGPGIGYFLIRRNDLQLSVEGGVSYLLEKVSDVSDDSLIFRLAQRYEQKLGDSAELWQSVEYLPEAEEFSSYLLNAELGVTARLNGSLGLRMVLQNRYDSTPAVSTKRNDFRVTAGLSYRF